MDRLRNMYGLSSGGSAGASPSNNAPAEATPTFDMWSVVRIQAAIRRWHARGVHGALIHSLGTQRQLAKDLIGSEQMFVAKLDLLEIHFVTPLQAAMPADEHAKLFALLPRLQNCHRVLLRQLEIRVQSGRAHCGLLGLLRQHASEFGLLVEYAKKWAAEGAFALWKFERTPQAGALLYQLQEAAGLTGPGGVKEVLELPLARLGAYEGVATELGCALFERSATEEMSQLLLALDEMQAQVKAALAPLARLRPLWGVLARFKPLGGSEVPPPSLEDSAPISPPGGSQGSGRS